MTVLSGMMVREAEVGHASYQEHLETYLGSAAMLRATGPSFGCENKNKQNKQAHSTRSRAMVPWSKLQDWALLSHCDL